ncbi:MAG: SAM-dependent DNA methyltransferase [Akkermansiaceae bacterium]|nr:SAM-dependent DNA methyltransferase [Akkermansiaceae bacterium]
MNFIEFESAQKLRGGFYTESAIAEYLVRWISEKKPKSILEPSCGDGSFLRAIKAVGLNSVSDIVACELDPVEAAKARETTKLPVEVLDSDFLRWYLIHGQNGKRFDAVLGNPPFIRYQYLPSEQQLLAEKIFSQLGLRFTKHTNAWVPFVLASLRLLKPGGRLAMVIPSEIFHIPHAQSLRQYLGEHCSKILIIDPKEIWFGETLQGTVLLLAEKKAESREKGHGVAVIPARSRESLNESPEEHFQSSIYANGSTIEGKWMPVFLTVEERALLSDLRSRDDVKKFSEIASVDVGIVTGANKFFLVPDATVSEFSLQRWAHPMFGRSNHVKGLVYGGADHESNKKTGLPANFLWFEEEQIEKLPANVRKYLDIGLSQSLHTRFKCRTRKTWYKVPSVYSAPIAMLKRAHHFPRLVLNSAEAYTTDTAYRIQPLNIKPAQLVFGFVNSLTSLTAEMEGRHYGGGVLELVPSEIERLLVPVIKATNRDLQMADKRFRSVSNDTDFLRIHDALVLGRLGLSESDQDSLHSAWMKLRDRRHRVDSSAVKDSAK